VRDRISLESLLLIELNDYMANVEQKADSDQKRRDDETASPPDKSPPR